MIGIRPNPTCVQGFGRRASLKMSVDEGDPDSLEARRSSIRASIRERRRSYDPKEAEARKEAEDTGMTDKLADMSTGPSRPRIGGFLEGFWRVFRVKTGPKRV